MVFQLLKNLVENEREKHSVRKQANNNKKKNRIHHLSKTNHINCFPIFLQFTGQLCFFLHGITTLMYFSFSSGHVTPSFSFLPW